MNNDPPRNHYQFLGIAEYADCDDVKAAVDEMSRLAAGISPSNPDRSFAIRDRIRQIRQDLLSSGDQKTAYDAQLRQSALTDSPDFESRTDAAGNPPLPPGTNAPKSTSQPVQRAGGSIPPFLAPTLAATMARFRNVSWLSLLKPRPDADISIAQSDSQTRGRSWQLATVTAALLGIVAIIFVALLLTRGSGGSGIHSNLALVLIGLGIGFLVGVTGVGGGSLMTPILILWVGVSPAVAVGTDLVYTAFTRSVGAVVHLRQSTVNRDAVRWLATGSVPSALITTILVSYFLTTAKQYTQGFITKSLAAVLILVAVSLVLRPLYEGRLKGLSVGHRNGWAVATGVVVGALVALTSVGGGSLTLVALVVLFRLTVTSELIGTDVVHAALLSIAAAFARVFTATIDYHIVVMLLLGSFPGVVIGSRLTVRVPDSALRYGLAGTLGFVGFRLIGVSLA